MLRHSLPGVAGGSLPDVGLLDQQSQHAFQVMLIAVPKGNARPIHQFAILRNITGQSTNSGSHGIEQSQGRKEASQPLTLLHRVPC